MHSELLGVHEGKQHIVVQIPNMLAALKLP